MWLLTMPDVAILAEIDRLIGQLNRDEQLWLIERLAHRLRQPPAGEQTAHDAELAAMADDPDIQRELRQIADEFAAADADGLEESQ